MLTLYFFYAVIYLLFAVYEYNDYHERLNLSNGILPLFGNNTRLIFLTSVVLSIFVKVSTLTNLYYMLDNTQEKLHTVANILFSFQPIFVLVAAVLVLILAYSIKQSLTRFDHKQHQLLKVNIIVSWIVFVVSLLFIVLNYFEGILAFESGMQSYRIISLIVELASYVTIMNAIILITLRLWYVKHNRLPYFKLL